jgi:hypothetical protein
MRLFFRLLLVWFSCSAAALAVAINILGMLLPYFAGVFLLSGDGRQHVLSKLWDGGLVSALDLKTR